jgi:aerobic carbon-monoxide dehydrogenase medium subunit
MINPHPGLPEFDYIKPGSLEEASQFLAQHPVDARPFLGGTDCFVRMRDGIWKINYLVDVKQLDGMNRISFDPATGLTFGASIKMNQIVESPEVNQYYPLLAEAAHTVASYQLRNRATVIGNICNASPAGDTIGACIVYEGVLHVYNAKGTRTEPLRTFFKGPGKTVLQPGDIVTAISFPVPPMDHVGKYVKLGRNRSGDLSIVGVTALGYADNKQPSGYSFKLALASVAPVPLIPGNAEELLANKLITEITIAEAAEAAMHSCIPIDDVRGGAQYRKYMVRNLTRQALTDVWTRIHQKGG